MFDNDAFHKRGQAIEDEFFHRVDEQLREQLREKMEREDASKQLTEATGLDSPQLIGHLLDAGFSVSTVTALALIPPVFVAWADGNVTPAERETVIHDALKRGVDSNQVALQLVETWLKNRPPRSLWKLWLEYVGEIGNKLPAEQTKSLLEEIHQRSTEVAKASGGTLGIGKISKEEQQYLDEIKKLIG